MAISVVNSWRDSHTRQEGVTAHQLTVAPSAGNTLIVMGMSSNGYNAQANLSNITASDSVQLTIDQKVTWSISYEAFFARYTNVPSGITSITMNQIGADWWSMIAYEVSGLASSPVDVKDTTGNYSGTGTTSWNTGSGTTTNNDDILFFNYCSFGQNSTTLTCTGYTNTVFGVAFTNEPYGWTGYKIVSATQDMQASGTTNQSDSYGAHAASYKAAAAATGITVSGYYM